MLQAVYPSESIFETIRGTIPDTASGKFCETYPNARIAAYGILMPRIQFGPAVIHPC